MTDDLIERLEYRKKVVTGYKQTEDVLRNPDGPEAAARIRELEAAQTNPFTESFKATVAQYDDLPDGHKTDYERSHAPAPVTVQEVRAALGQLLEQVYQMQGMFPNDEALELAIQDAEDALK